MRGDEIAGQLLAPAKGDKIGDPFVVGGGRTTDPQFRVDRLDRRRTVPVQLEVIGLRAGPERGKVRLVPDLEEPLPHLVDAVTRDPVVDELADQRVPVGQLFRRRDIAAIAEHGLVSRGKRARHETQFDEWPHADLAQEIHDQIGVVEAVAQLVFLVQQGGHVVVEQGVEAHVTDAEFLMDAAHLRLPVCAQRHVRVIAADGVRPDMRQRGASAIEIAAKFGHCGTLTNCRKKRSC
jgi:hypothetical protein